MPNVEGIDEKERVLRERRPNSDNKDELLTLMAETRDVRRHWISTGSPDITTVIQRYPRLLDMNSAVSYLMALSDKHVATGNKVT